jgi:hypothetical protein
MIKKRYLVAAFIIANEIHGVIMVAGLLTL